MSMASSGKAITGYYPSTDIEGETTIIGTPSPTSPATIISKEPYGLNKVGTYADEYLLNGGTVDGIVVPSKGILRRVGVKVLDGTELWLLYSYAGYKHWQLEDSLPLAEQIYASSHFNHDTDIRTKDTDGIFSYRAGYWYFNYNAATTAADFKAYLASEYAKGTPVTVYYPLATPIVEQPHMAIVPSFKSLVVRKSRNLFDKRNVINAYIDSYGKIATTSANNLCFAEVKPNTKYTISSGITQSGNSRLGEFSQMPSSGVSGVIIKTYRSEEETLFTFTTNADTKFIAIHREVTQQFSQTLQLEEGSVATTYEPYGLIPIPSYKSIIKL